MNRPLVMVVEDEGLIALDMQYLLEDNGFSVGGPFRSEAAAMAALDGGLPDIAVLDINLGRGRTTFGIARRLREAGVPVIFLTGYSASTVDIPSDMGDVARLLKPVNDARLVATITERLVYT